MSAPDMATRYQPRLRAQAYLDHERAAMPDDSEGDSTDSLPRRKFQRTSAAPSEADAFRKPSLPASAIRHNTVAASSNGAPDRRPSLSQRRRSVLRENMGGGVRVPSGPREFPGSPGRRLLSSTIAPPFQEATNIDRAYLPHTASEPYMAPPSSTQPSQRHAPRFSLAGKPQVHIPQHPSVQTIQTPTTPAENISDAFDFVPTVNFDDFQNSIVDPHWKSPVAAVFPRNTAGRLAPKETAENADRGGMARQAAMSVRPDGLSKQQDAGEGGVGRSASVRRRMSGAVQNGQAPTFKQPQGLVQSSMSQPNLSVRTRRQSTMPAQLAATAPPQAAQPPMNRTPRKSLGAGLLSGIGEGRRLGQAPQMPVMPIESPAKPSVARTASLSKTGRRTTLLPSAAGTEVPRTSTLTATTQSRANKVKSLQPPPRNQDLTNLSDEPNTPSSRRTAASKIQDKNRAHTPSSSGNKRQSQSGRASGLGARTISPTDARRLKRMSMIAPPMPLPSASLMPKGPPTPAPQDDDPLPNPWVKPELPRLTQPSPSLIPRKMSASTPTSARASPENRHYPYPLTTVGATNGGGTSLSTKSSYQSFASLTEKSERVVSWHSNQSNSRLPTPKPRTSKDSHRDSHSSSAQYGENEYNELVPPVPAIPKAYESPGEREMPFFSGLRSSQFGNLEPSASTSALDAEQTFPFTRDAPTPASAHAELTPRKRSGELPRHHRRTNTATAAMPPALPSAPMSFPRQHPQPDATGRKNNNLQPLRLPPLNLMPLDSHIGTSQPRPSKEIDRRADDYASVQTPEPRGGYAGVRAMAKTPSTPMTASKATFFRRQDEANKMGGMFAGNGGYGAGLRSSSSHYALRDLQNMNGFDTSHKDIGSDMNLNGGTRLYDDSDSSDAAGVAGPTALGVPIHGNAEATRTAKHRSTVTPFASGSLPKGSAEFARPRADFQDDFDLGNYAAEMKLRAAAPQGPRMIGGAVKSRKEGESAVAQVTPPLHPSSTSSIEVPKKEKEIGGLRRKLSLGWRRSSSKGAIHAENQQASKSSPQQGQDAASDRERESKSRAQKMAMEMPPPKLPASASAQWEKPAPPRQSLESLNRTKSTLMHSASAANVLAGNGGLSVLGMGGLEKSTVAAPASPATSAPKTRALHSSQPQPVPVSNGTRASSWGGSLGPANTNGSNNHHDVTASDAPASRQGPIGRPSIISRHHPSASTFSALIKDKDDLLADTEMLRLSQKRKDVDAAARESEILKLRAVARSPVGVDDVLKGRGKPALEGSLNVFERGEVMDYAEEGVWFTGTKGAKKIIGSLSSSPTLETASKDKDAATGKAGNYGYDDERGDYNIVMGDHLAYRYEVVDLLGKGSFGQVVRCVDHKEGGVVAIKIIRNKKRFHQQALVEVGILGKLSEWDPDGANATLSITTSFYFRSHLCIVTPCLSINLYEFIRAHNFTGFSLPLIRRFSRQLLACLVLLQQKHIIHCDLKPENILLCEARKADVRVIDFGSSCREEEKVYTYIQSRFYRSPEVILGSSYGLGIDMWSLGCILAELWTGYPIFPGENEQEQLACIMEIFGPPDRHLVERCTRKKLFFDSVGKPRVTVSSKGRRRRPSSKTLAQALKTEDDAFVDFVSRCLRWDPERRIKPNEAMMHPFVRNVALGSRQPGIPEEARRAARIRSTAAVPAATATNVTNGGNPSPVKSSAVVASAKDGNAFAQLASTPHAKERQRPLPETPQTAVRNAGPTSAYTQGSPSRPAAGRRHSSVANAAGAAAVAGTKRASNGTLLSTAGSGLMGAPRMAPVTVGGNLAQMAARESMGAGSAGGAGRWRS